MATHRRTSPEGERSGPNVVSVQPSSLIFLVIIAIWAAYFIQHWVRRREHLATARSVDQFSESMRVLERRLPLPEANLSTPQPRSYAVSPARPARPQVLVKRAAPAEATAEPQAPVAAPAASSSAAASGRRARGLTLLGSLAALLVMVALASFAVVSWISLLAPVAAIAGVLVWMRRSAQAERAARRRATAPQRSQGRKPAQRPATRRTETQSPTRRAAVAEETPAAWQGADSAEADSPDGAEAEQHVRESFYDIQAVERESVAHQAAQAAPAPAAAAAWTPLPAVPLVDEDDIPLTWDPVPVPRPTYTMKAMAQRPAAPVGQGVPPELAEPAYEEPVRRVAGA